MVCKAKKFGKNNLETWYLVVGTASKDKKNITLTVRECAIIARKRSFLRHGSKIK
jgi:hypothetical protein